jgi:hypothetical protein
MDKIRACAVCGNIFIPKKANSKYCGEKCAGKAYSEKYKRCKKKRKAEQEKRMEAQRSITDIAVAARQAGMTYGQYVVKMGL